MAVWVGRPATTNVPAATLWATPESPRAVDLPLMAPRPDIATWVAAMTAQQRGDSEVLSQLLLGERVHVAEIRPDGWARVIAVEQPAPRRDPAGYPGWLPVEHLTPAGTPHLAPSGPATVADRPDGPRPGPPGVRGAAPVADPAPTTLVVGATVTCLREAPDGATALPGILLGTRLISAGPASGGWRPVYPPDRPEPLWIPESEVVDPPGTPPAPAEILATASRLSGVPYVWGGLSVYGIDCSGLVHLVWRRFGVRLPRDAADQARTASTVVLGDERPGDLYVFARPGRPIHHIGIVSAVPDGSRRRMLHACHRSQRVLEEELPADRTDTLVGAVRVTATPAASREARAD